MHLPLQALSSSTYSAIQYSHKCKTSFLKMLWTLHSIALHFISFIYYQHVFSGDGDTAIKGDHTVTLRPP